MIYKYTERDFIEPMTGKGSSVGVTIKQKVSSLIGFPLLWISILLSILFLPICFLYGSVYSLFKGKIGEYYLEIATSVDQTGNVIGRYLLSHVFKKKGGANFGNRDETISSALGKNRENNSLTFFGKVLVKILDIIDPNHSLDSIEYYVEGENSIETLVQLSDLRLELSRKFPDVNFSEINLNENNATKEY